MDIYIVFSYFESNFLRIILSQKPTTKYINNTTQSTVINNDIESLTKINWDIEKTVYYKKVTLIPNTI